MSERHFLENEMLPSPMIALAFLTAVTSRIRLGTGVLLLPLHDPVRAAEDAAVLGRLSGGGEEAARVELAAEIGDAWYADPITPRPIIAGSKSPWREALAAHEMGHPGIDPERVERSIRLAGEHVLAAA